MRLSIIIPAYNVASYIERCLDSVLNQSIDDYEVIVINDGSTDNTYDVANNFISKHENGNRVKLLSQNNKGLSETRNVGLSYATGEYITFIDSDDYIETNILNKIFAEISNSPISPDYVLMEMTSFSRRNERHVFYNYREKKYLYNEDILKFSLHLHNIESACSKLYKKEIIDRYNLKFKKIIMHEDAVFNYSYLEKSRSLLILPINFYFYEAHFGSLTVKFYGETYLPSLYEFIDIQTDFYKRNNIYSDAKNIIDRYKAFNILFGFYSIYRAPKVKHKYSSFKKYWTEACKNDKTWKSELDSGIPKLIVKLSDLSLYAAHCFLNTLFTVEKLKHRYLK